MKNSYIKKHKSVVNREALSLLHYLHYFCKSLIFHLWVDSWALLVASTFRLLWYVVWLKYIKKNPGSQRYVVGKGRLHGPHECISLRTTALRHVCFIMKTSYWPKKKEVKTLLRDSILASKLIRTNCWHPLHCRHLYSEVV